MAFEDRPLPQDRDSGLFDVFSSSRATPWPSIPHYYGNATRQLLLAGAALMLLASPLYGDNLHVEFPFEVLGAFAAVGLAALTSPRSRLVSIGDSIVSGVGMVVYAAWGIFGYDTINPIAFVLRLSIAVIFLFAFYFSTKTVRAFILDQIGRRDQVDEFESGGDMTKEDELERENVEGQQHSGNIK